MAEGLDPTGIRCIKIREERAEWEGMAERVILGCATPGAVGEEVTVDPAEWGALWAARMARSALRKRGATVGIVPMGSIILGREVPVLAAAGAEAAVQLKIMEQGPSGALEAGAGLAVKMRTISIRIGMPAMGVGPQKVEADGLMVLHLIYPMVSEGMADI
jgi:hypothetical protein